MVGRVNLPFWSDEERLFVLSPLGFTLNFKHVVRKLGWVKTPVRREPKHSESSLTMSRTHEERLREAIERSRFERPSTGVERDETGPEDGKAGG